MRRGRRGRGAVSDSIGGGELDGCQEVGKGGEVAVAELGLVDAEIEVGWVFSWRYGGNR